MAGDGYPERRLKEWWRSTHRLEPRVLATVLGLLFACWSFLALAGEVREQETTTFDRDVLLFFRVPGNLATPEGPRWLQETARDITALGGFTTLTLLTLTTIAILLVHGRRLQALIFGLAVVSAQLAAELLKAIFDRARPDLVPHLDLVYSSSFPSGHAMMAPVVYLTLASIISAGESRLPARLLLLGVAAALVAAIGVSRVYLGVHWPTDVLAGWTAGVAISLAASFALHATARKQTGATTTVE